ncbi:CLUMA_CG004771, isoform A [Clunio marinus]|uniref:CLUMA_CG004771, isoform A n=1 Tax=Clunio marinus TaxID=568069 RepID=A0A1J1HSW1_9DIPT|nr:CLUMA_CG004771, isoform A [Clunio marinus]
MKISQKFCYFCNKSYLKSNLQRHIDSVHYKKILKTCNICNKSFKSDTHYQYHMAQHEDRREFQCSLCVKTFNTNQDLWQHSRNHNKKEASTTKISPETFPNNQLHKSHQNKHEQKKVNNVCPFCDKTFRYLNDHIKTVHYEHKYFCGFEGCNKSFAKLGGLNRHLKIHCDDFKDFHCPVCSKRFAEKSQLERHFHVHFKAEKKTDFRCDKCLNYYNRQSDLKRHIKSIHSEKKYQCDQCDRRFRSKFEVLQHFKVIHLGQKAKRSKRPPKVPFNDILNHVYDEIIVEALDDTFDITESLDNTEHIEFDYLISEEQQLMNEAIFLQVFQPPIKWECQRCNRFYETPEKLKLHNIRNHNWKCKKCPNTKDTINIFYRKEDFQLHWIEIHNDETFPDKLECTICGDMFATKAALCNHNRNEHKLESIKKV